jgi:hypothetical protein
MRYASNEAHDAFIGGGENFGKPLRMLEASFIAAGLNITFECALGIGAAKVVKIFESGVLLQRIKTIEGDSPAAAVKDVAAAVKV